MVWGTTSDPKINVRNLALHLAVVFLYAVLGGVALHYIEQPGFLDQRMKTRERLLELNVTGDLRNELENVLKVCAFPEESDKHWGWVSASFFALTTVTTIGFGNWVPVTAVGRFFTIVFAAAGIGLVLNSLGNVASLLMALAETCFVMPLAAARKLDHGVLTRNAQQEALGTFETYDESRTGALDGREFAKFLRAVNNGAEVDPIVVEHVFLRADVNGSGNITKDELMGALALFYQLQSTIPTKVPWSRLGVGASVLLLWMIMWGMIVASVEGWN
eukprot:Hpha_TRINITY_DN3405_c0_g2::TRINITY_DN3405_c0_g2_i1::g.32637::m.32637